MVGLVAMHQACKESSDCILCQACITVKPTNHNVCSGMTGHTEAVLVFFEPRIASYETLLKTFWESHDPTQGMRQGNDSGTQYRSAIYFSNAEQEKLAQMSLGRYQQALHESGKGAPITTELALLQNFYYPEDYHQQYLAKSPGGYCGLGWTGVCYLPG